MSKPEGFEVAVERMTNDDGLRCKKREKPGLYVVEGGNYGGESGWSNA